MRRLHYRRLRCTTTVSIGLLSCVVGWSGSASIAATVRVERIDGASLTGEWLGSTDGRTIDLAAVGAPTSISTDDVRTIQFIDTSDAESTSSAATNRGEVVDLADGGRLFGRLIRVDEQGVVADCPLGPAARFPLERVAGVRLADPLAFPRAAALYDSALGDRLPGDDVLITRSADEPTSLRGALEELNGTAGSFAFGGRSRGVQSEKIYGVVFAVGVRATSPSPMRFELADGSTLTGQIATATERSLTVNTSFDARVEVAVSSVQRIDVTSPRVVYLSDQPAKREITEGRLHRPEPARRDRGLTGRPLQIAGRTFAKGLACRSRCEMEWALDGAFESFVATIGLDDDVRPRGSVAFRVLIGDPAAVEFDSGMVTGRDAPRDIRVDLSGAESMTLVVDYGDAYDLADHAVWGDARLIRRAE